MVVLYHLRSVYNVASIFRTAEAAGVEKIYLCGVTPGPVDRFGRERKQFIKVSLGAEKTVEWESEKNAINLIKKLKAQDYRVLAVEQSKNSIPYYQYNDVRRHYIEKTALVLGNEVSGLPKVVLDRADKVLEIPMKGRKESLNVAVSFGIVVFSLLYSSK